MATARQQIETPCVCARLRHAARRIKDFYDKTLAPAGISTAQYSLLVNLDRMEGCGTGDLARAVGHEKSTLVRTLQPLLQADLIEDRSPRASRRRVLYLTPKGRSAMHEAHRLWKEAQDAIHARLGDKNGQFLDLLRMFDSL